MYKGRKGRRCQVCTGCGLCPGVVPESVPEGMHVLAEEVFAGKEKPLRDWAAEQAGPAGQADVEGSERDEAARSADGAGAEQTGSAGRRRLVTADIGTTTVAMLLYGTDGAVADRFVACNPQREYGADVISRIRAAGEGGKAGEMQRRIRETLEQGLERFRGRIGEGETLFLVAAANTAMQYLLMGRDTAELGRAPFLASFLWEAEARLGDTPCFLMPGLSAFVGGDITAGILACGMDERKELLLLIDLGTNGEIVLGNSGRCIACATAAGPAFEGGGAGGVWGADMVSLLAALRREGALDETGLLADRFFDTGIRVGNVLITQEAVRGVQLAKAAVAAGIETLLDRYGVTPRQVDGVILAGGFGYYLRPEDAVQIGLLPAEWAGKAFAGGNTALVGALTAGRMLFEDPAGAQRLAERLERLAAGTECLNLAQETDFGPRYIDRMELNEMFLYREDSCKI